MKKRILKKYARKFEILVEDIQEEFDNLVENDECHECEDEKAEALMSAQSRAEEAKEYLEEWL